MLPDLKQAQSRHNLRHPYPHSLTLLSFTMLSRIPFCILLLSVIHLAAAQNGHSYHPSSLPFLSSRPAYPRDVVGNWTFIYSENDTMCPQSIRHLGFSRRKNSPIRIFHQRIIQDEVRCRNIRGFDGRRFRLFPSKVVRAAFRNRTTPYRIPPRLVKLLNDSIPVKRAFRAANKHGEVYLIGYEGRARVCDDKRLFRKGTIAFLLRPGKTDLNIKGIGVSLTPGKRYLLMIPPFKGISCVYSSELRQTELAAEAGDDREDTDDEALDESGNELEAKGDSGSCFPAAASVRLLDGRQVFMKDLSVRDSVQVDINQFASVFMFTHRLRDYPSIFRRIELQSGERLDITDGHYVYANGRLVTASQVRIGDMMPIANGTHSTVKALSYVNGLGLFNPQTTHGDIIVNGIRVSTYTEAVKPRVAHTILAPLRAAFSFLNLDLSCGYLDRGAGAFQSVMRLLR